MSRSVVVFLFLMITGIKVNAQLNKLYLNKAGAATTDSSKAKSYILYYKLDADSAWAMSHYDMQNRIISEGTFKDEKLTIAHGKFTFYEFIPIDKPGRYTYKNLTVGAKIDSGGNFIQQSGVMLYGKKNGPWKIYNHGKLQVLYTYHNSVLNGSYQKYGINGKVIIDGNFVNNVRQGNWNSLSYIGDVIKTEVYKDGNIVNTISYLNDEKFAFKISGKASKYDIPEYLNSKLSDKKFRKKGEFNAIYSFKLTSEGKLISPETSKTSDLEIDEAIISKMLIAPNWEPVIKNDILKIYQLMTDPDTAEGKTLLIPIEFKIVINNDHKIHISYLEVSLFKYN